MSRCQTQDASPPLPFWRALGLRPHTIQLNLSLLCTAPNLGWLSSADAGLSPFQVGIHVEVSQCIPTLHFAMVTVWMYYSPAEIHSFT